MGGDTMRQERKHPCEEAESVASAMECTGLVPALQEDEGDDYARQLYAIQLAKQLAKRSDK